MGWREVLNDVLAAQPLDGIEVIPSLMEMPVSDRIALARELVKGTGSKVVDDDVPPRDDQRRRVDVPHIIDGAAMSKDYPR